MEASSSYGSNGGVMGGKRLFDDGKEWMKRAMKRMEVRSVVADGEIVDLSEENHNQDQLINGVVSNIVKDVRMELVSNELENSYLNQNQARDISIHYQNFNSGSRYHQEYSSSRTMQVFILILLLVKIVKQNTFLLLS
jgi:hypothetical protein